MACGRSLMRLRWRPVGPSVDLNLALFALSSNDVINQYSQFTEFSHCPVNQSWVNTGSA